MNALIDVLDNVVTKVTAIPNKEVKEVSNKEIEQYIALALTAGRNAAEVKSLRERSASLMEAINKTVQVLFKADVKIGRAGKCSIATAFTDGLLDGGLTKGTAQNYLSVFRKAVAEGSVIAEWNPAQKSVANEVQAEKSAPKAKGASHRAAPEFSTQVKKVFEFGDSEAFKSLCFEIEELYNDDKIDSIYAGFIQFLEREAEIKPEGGKAK